MASQNFARALAFTLAFEGGWSDNPKDPGGATMCGVTLRTYRIYHPRATASDLRKAPVLLSTIRDRGLLPAKDYHDRC